MALLDHALRAQLHNLVCIVPQDLAVDALIMLSETGWRLIESGLGIRESYGQSHGVNPIGRAVLGMDQRNGLVSGDHSRIVNRCLRIAYFRRRNPGGIERGNSLSSRFGVAPAPDLRIQFAIVPHAHVSCAEALIRGQFAAAHHLEEAMGESIGICTYCEVPILGWINPKRGEPLHGLAGAYRLAALLHS